MLISNFAKHQMFIHDFCPIGIQFLHINDI